MNNAIFHILYTNLIVFITIILIIFVMSSKIIRRKLQFAGNSSYVVTLPKDWIKDVNLDTQDAEVNISWSHDGSLKINPANIATQEIKDSLQIIKISKNDTTDNIIRLILGSYLGSKNRIILKPDKTLQTIPAKYLIAAEKITQKLWGAEIIEEQVDSLVIQDALNESQMKLTDIIEKAKFTANNMLNRAATAVFHQDQDAAQIVLSSENTLDKLYYFALRQLYKSSKDILFAHDIGIKPSEIIDFHLLIKNIERMGDHAEKIVKEIVPDYKYSLEIEEIFEMAKEACNNSVEAFIKKNQNLALETIDKKNIISDKVDKLKLNIEEYQLQKSILRLADYASDIGELVLNRIINDQDIRSEIKV
jgi:phosphate uptake regulator